MGDSGCFLCHGASENGLGTDRDIAVLVVCGGLKQEHASARRMRAEFARVAPGEAEERLGVEMTEAVSCPIVLRNAGIGAQQRTGISMSRIWTGSKRLAISQALAGERASKVGWCIEAAMDEGHDSVSALLGVVLCSNEGKAARAGASEAEMPTQSCRAMHHSAGY